MPVCHRTNCLKISSPTQPDTPPSAPAVKLWHLDSPFRVRVLSATYVNVKEADLIYVRVGVYHGTEALCPPRKTKLVREREQRKEVVEIQFPDSRTWCMKLDLT